MPAFAPVERLAEVVLLSVAIDDAAVDDAGIVTAEDEDEAVVKDATLDDEDASVLADEGGIFVDGDGVAPELMYSGVRG